MKRFSFSKVQYLTLFSVFVLLLSSTMVYAQGGASALSSANVTIRTYWEPLKLIIQAIGGVIGLIGGVRIYNKWTNGDQDINKEIVGWGGACLFLVIVPQFVGSFFAM